MHLGPRDFALYSGVLAILFTVYILIDHKPTPVMRGGALVPWRVVTATFIVAVVTGTASYAFTSLILDVCSTVS